MGLGDVGDGGFDEVNDSMVWSRESLGPRRFGSVLTKLPSDANQPHSEMVTRGAYY